MTLQEILALNAAEMGVQLKLKEEEVMRLSTPKTGEALLPADVESAVALDAECDSIRAAIDANDKSIQRANDLRVKTQKEMEQRSQPVNGLRTPNAGGDTGIRIPHGQGVRYKRLENVKDEGRAFAWGQFFRSMSLSNDGVKNEAATWLKENGIMDVRALSSNDNSLGGVFIPTLLAQDIITLRENYGVFRPNTNVVPMSGGTLMYPRLKTGQNYYWIGESSPTTGSNLTFDNVQLVAKKISSLFVIPDELAADAIINLGDYAAGQFAYYLSLAEDNVGFIADGTSTYGGMTGVINAINGVASNKGIQVASGSGYATDYSSITRADLHKLKSKATNQALQSPDTAWYMHSTVFSAVVENIAFALGGNMVGDFGDGMNPKLLGFPVRFTQVMPSASAINQICILFGSLKLATLLGDRSGIAIKATKEGQYWDNDQTGYKAQERIDIVTHSPGTATVAGPVVALKTSGT